MKPGNSLSRPAGASESGYLVRRAFSWRYYGALFVLVLGALLMYCASVANGPDRELYFSREIHSSQPLSRLSQRIENVSEWPKWFHMLADARIAGGPAHPLKDGTIILLSMDPGRGKSHRFEITARVERYIPGRSLYLRVLDESTGKLFRLFGQLEWRIDLAPEAGGTLIRGIETAHTANWRSRLFGSIAERILMYQVFYPDLMKLSDPTWGPASTRGLPD